MAGASTGGKQLEQGAAALREGQVAVAFDLLAHAVADNAEDVDARALLGIVYSLKGFHDSALRSLRGAVEARPDDADLRFHLGMASERAGDPLAAAVAYHGALQRQSAHQDSRRRLAELDPKVLAMLRDTCGEVSPLAEPASPPANGVYPSAYWAAAFLFRDYHVDTGMGKSEAFFRRWAACILDHVAVGLVWALLAVALGVRIPAAIFVIGPALMNTRTSADVFVGCIYYVLFVGYEVVCLTTTGRTLGKRLLGLTVVSENGGPVDAGQALLRATIGRLLCDIPLYVGYLRVLWNEHQQGWHDRLGRTAVVRARDEG